MSSSKQEARRQERVVGGEDPLHALSRKQTNASMQQQYAVWKVAQAQRRQEIKTYGASNGNNTNGNAESPTSSSTGSSAAYTPSKSLYNPEHITAKRIQVLEHQQQQQLEQTNAVHPPSSSSSTRTPMRSTSPFLTQLPTRLAATSSSSASRTPMRASSPAPPRSITTRPLTMTPRTPPATTTTPLRRPKATPLKATPPKTTPSASSCSKKSTQASSSPAAAASATRRRPTTKATPPRSSQPSSARVKPEVPSPAVPKTSDMKQMKTTKLELPTPKQAMELFTRTDENGSGKLSLAEVDKVVHTLYPALKNKPALMRAYQAADTSNNGYLEREEFIFFLHYLLYYNNLWTLFAAVDQDADRRISRAEFQRAAAKLAAYAAQSKNVEKFPTFDEIDTNQGGYILFHELCHYMAVNHTHQWAVLDEADTEKIKSHLQRPATSSPPKTRNIPSPSTAVHPEAITKILVPPKEEAMKVFDRLDGNASGKLSLAELDKGVITLYPKFNNKPAIMAAYKASDRTGDGFVERSEFGYFLRYLAYYNNLWSVFAAVDTDGDRRLSLHEFVSAADKLDELDGVDDAAEIFEEIDTNHGGMILFDELCDYMAKHKSKWGANESDVEHVKNKLNATPKSAKASPRNGSAGQHHPDAVMEIQVPPKDEAMKLFDRLDENASGKLSLAELDKGVITLYPKFNNKPAIMAAYKASDRSGDGFVERSEFGYFLRYVAYYNNLWSVFAMVDTDADRRLSRQEFLSAAKKLDLDGVEAARVFEEIDTNRGGMILFDELCDYMAKHKSNWGAHESDVKDFQGQLNAANSHGAFSASSLDEDEDFLKTFDDEFDDDGKDKVPEAIEALPPEAEIENLFDALDPNANGMLSLAELDKGMMEHRPEFNHKPAIMAAYKAADRNGDGFVRRSEFPFFLRFIQYYTNMFQIFSSLDEDGDRRITKEEFVVGANQLDLHPDDAALAFDEVDQNGGGMVLFDELVRWLATQ